MARTPLVALTLIAASWRAHGWYVIAIEFRNQSSHGARGDAALTPPVHSDVSYDFGGNATARTTRMEVTLTWWAVTPQPSQPNVYMSTATGTACNTGYFGAQFHSDGTQSLLFSMWDAPAFNNNSQFVFQSLPGSAHCKRNALDASGKSTGVQCAPHIGGEKVSLQFGVPCSVARSETLILYGRGASATR
jgi:hypothetical protein